MCLYPKLLRNPKYQINKKNGGHVPAVHDTRVLLVPIGCGDCIECRKQKANQWRTRLLEDIKEHKNGKFITLTFSDKAIANYASELNKLKGYALDNAIATRAIRMFTERWRRKFKKTIRHWFVTELGHKGTKNIHLHGIVWTNESFETIRAIWNGGKTENGFMWPRPGYESWKNYVSERTINYTVKYIHKIDLENKHYKSIVLTSNGIGSNYIKSPHSNAINNKFKGTETNEGYRTNKGHEIGLPTYYRNKIYNDHEREQLWIQKLNKQERWVLGNRIDISQGEENYYRALEQARKKNSQMGYGKGQSQWIREQYENERRQLIINKRIEKGKKKNT